MSWYAVEALDEAVEDTKDLLLPFDLGTWLRLALIVVFTGGSFGFANPLSFVPSDLDDTSQTDGVEVSNLSETANSDQLTATDGNAVTGLVTASSSISDTVWVTVGFILIGSVILLFYLSSIFEFIYYQSLLDHEVSIRENFRKHWSNGLRYFGFKLIYLLVTAGLVIGIIAGFIINPLGGILGVFVAIPVFILLAVFSGLVHDFALLQMIKHDEGLISAWKSIWPDLREQWREVIIYLVVKLGIGIAVGITVTTLAVALLIPFIIVFGILAALFGFLADILVVVPLLLGIFLFLIALLGITIVVRTFVYFFVIEVYRELFS